MSLTDREKAVLNNIREWESNLLNYEANDLELTYEKYLERSFSLLPEKVQSQFFLLLIAGCFICMESFKVLSFKWMPRKESFPQAESLKEFRKC